MQVIKPPRNRQCKRIKGKRPGKHVMWSRQARLPRYDEGVYSLETVYRYRFRPINRMRISIKERCHIPYHSKAFSKRLRATFSDVLEAIDEMLLRTSYEEIDDDCDET